MTITQTLKAEAEDLFPQLVEWRRDFHTHPEMGFEEVRTAGIVADHLRDLGLEVSTGVGKTGVIALVEADDTPADAPTVMLRFDMDALPIEEETGLEFRSQNPGVMHACGHDGHTAMGMGVAKLLTKHRNELNGRVKLVFQPAEELGEGALAMIADGALDGPTPSAAFGLHLWSRLPLNQIVVQPGPLWARSDFFTVTIQGQGGHGAVPQETVDATLIASELVVAWQSIVSRNVDPTETAVLSVGSVHSGSAANIIAGEATLTGTIRTFNDDVADLIVKRMQEIADGICQAFGASNTFEFDNGTGVTQNSEAGAALMREVATEVVGEEQVVQITPMMVGEDMAEFLDRAPGCFILVGASDPAEEMHSPHHNPTFDFDERMMPTGVAALAGAAVAYLEQNG